MHEAEVRTREFYEGRARAPVTWILVDGKNIPTNVAIVGGEEHGTPHYICRGYHEVRCPLRVLEICVGMDADHLPALAACL